MAEAIPGAPSGSPIVSIVDPVSEQEEQQPMWSHRRLMAAYADVIKTVTSSNPLPEVVPKSARQELVNTTSTALLAIPRAFNAAFNDFNELSRKPPRSYKHKPVTKALVESHVKGKLSELQAIYAQIEQSIPEATATKPVLSWLRETQKSLADFSSTLSMMLLVRRICAALWSLAIGLVAVGALWSAIFHVVGYGKRPLYIAVYALSVISYCLFGLALAGRRKRNLFLRPVQVLPPTWASDSQDTPTKSITAKNIYLAEDKLFKFLDRSKRPEFPLDKYMSGVACFVIAGSLALQLPEETDWTVLLSFSWSGFLFLCLGTESIVSGYNRVHGCEREPT